MKFILLVGLGLLWFIPSLAGDTEGKLAMEEVVGRALAANPMLKAAAAKWAAFKERVPQAKAWEDPMIGVDFERMGTTRFSTYSDAEWMASQSLPIAGKNLSRGRAAEAEARAAFEEVRRLRLEITAKVVMTNHAVCKGVELPIPCRNLEAAIGQCLLADAHFGSSFTSRKIKRCHEITELDYLACNTHR